MAHILPPFRADHVGSFLRTEKIANARNLFNKKLISKEELTKIEDEEIALLVEAEKKNGLKAVTDGEFRRAYWHPSAGGQRLLQCSVQTRSCPYRGGRPE